MKKFMRFKKIFLIINLVGNGVFLHASFFEQKHAILAPVQTILDSHKQELIEQKKKWDALGQDSLVNSIGVKQFPWLPDYYVKHGMGRIEGANILKQTIIDNNLNLLDVPDKGAYQDLVIAQKIKGTLAPKLTLLQTQQLYVLMDLTHYWDAHGQNLVAANNKIYIIDTGGNFWEKPTVSMDRLLCDNRFEPDARAWLSNKVENNNKKLLCGTALYLGMLTVGLYVKSIS